MNIYWAHTIKFFSGGKWCVLGLVLCDRWKHRSNPSSDGCWCSTTTSRAAWKQWNCLCGKQWNCLWLLYKLAIHLESPLLFFLLSLQIPALRTTGNIVTGSNTQTQILLDSGILKHFTHLLRHHDSNIQKVHEMGTGKHCVCFLMFCTQNLKLEVPGRAFSSTFFQWTRCMCYRCI